MKHFVLFVFVFALFFVFPTRADDILVKEKDAEPTVHASDVFVYSTLKDNEGNISRISYVSWNAKDKSIQYDSVADYKDKTYSLVEANRDKKKEILQMLLEKGVCGERIDHLLLFHIEWNHPGLIPEYLHVFL